MTKYLWNELSYSLGEMVSANSPLFRDKFDPIKKQQGRAHHRHTRRNARHRCTNDQPFY
jgi:hypothetical protein